MDAENYLLNAIPQAIQQKLKPSLTLVSLEQGHRLHEPGETIEELYFPLDCALSITLTLSDGSTAETGIIGNREVIGINALMGGRETTQTTYIVQIPGHAIRIGASELRDEFDCNKELRDVLLRYTQAFIAQLSQTTACNSRHVLKRRLARWFLETQDRIGKGGTGPKELKLTQEFISDMLGVRRSGVTQTAQALQEQGLIQYHRGCIKILDQEGLEAASCECFKVLKDEYNRLLGEKHEKLP